MIIHTIYQYTIKTRSLAFKNILENLQNHNLHIQNTHSYLATKP